MTALTQLIEHEFKDHLPDGQHMNVNFIETKSAEKHNKFPDKIFAYFDHLSHLTVSLTNTDQWLATRDDSESQQNYFNQQTGS